MVRIIFLPEELQLVVDRLDEIEKVMKKEERQIEDPILDTKGVMNLLKVSQRCLQGLRDQAMVEYNAVYGKLFYKLSAIYKMLNEHLQKTGGEYV